MGILSASCSFTRFKITEPVPKELWMEIPAKLRQFAFQDIDDIAEERGWGWTSFEDMLDTQWRSAPPEKGAYLAFALPYIAKVKMDNGARTIKFIKK